MRATTLAYALLGAMLPAVLAVDVPASNVSNVAYGQQLQADDEANHWITWEEGKSACSYAQVLGPLVEELCNQVFDLPDSLNLEFRDCDEKGNPNALFSDGQFVRTCKHHKHTINCHKGHNVIKHGKCVE
ncbi:hypothetical protein ANO14919_032510 [Xylariales sp. No.14919]|nr:hypothetical protein ANO14919_032510 [Xylariales sp. No.14919]